MKSNTHPHAHANQELSLVSWPIFSAFCVQVVLLSMVAWLHRYQINPDAISYIRIAKYYLNLKTDLMISGYWGPMLSWLISPWLRIFNDPLIASRVVIALSAVVYLFGAYCVLRAAQLPNRAVVIGTWIVSFLSIVWFADGISPDLLMAGIICIGASMLLKPAWPISARLSLVAGMIMGASYLAKAVAFPISMLLIAAMAAINLATSQVTLRQAVRGVAITIAGFLIIAAPWVAALSLKYGYATFSTSARINHAIVGPTDVDRWHPTFRIFHEPEAGRVTSWEDPSGMPYEYWSPLSNMDYAQYQLNLAYQNSLAVVQILKNFDLFGLGLASALLAFVSGRPWRRALRVDRWRLSIIPIASIILVYAPVYSKDLRYFFVAVPFLLISSLGFGASLLSGKNRMRNCTIFFTFIAISFLIATGDQFWKTFHPKPTRDYEAARFLAKNLASRNLSGPVVSVGMIKGRDPHAGLYLAYLLDEPWFGHMKTLGNVNKIISSGAFLIIIPRGLELGKTLSRDSRVVSADWLLFGCNTKRREKFSYELYIVGVQSEFGDCLNQ